MGVSDRATSEQTLQEPSGVPPFNARIAEEHDCFQSIRKEATVGYGIVGILVIILLVVLIFYFVRRA